MTTNRHSSILAGAGCLLAGLACVGADWPQFRGPNSSGNAPESDPPTRFGPERNVLWQLPLASGHSSPCIAENDLFLTTFEQETKRLAVVCIDRRNGVIRWERAVPAKEIEKGHPSFNPASSTTAADGERVVAYFGSYGLICFDRHGEKLWEVPMPLAKSFGGNAASPAIMDDRVILYRGNAVDHYLLAVDKHTGRELWKVPQEEPFHSELSCTACPIRSGDQVILHSARSVQSFDLVTGTLRWVTKAATTATSTPVLAGDEVIVAAWNKLGEPELAPRFPEFDELIASHDKDGDRTIRRDELPTLWIFHRPQGAEAPMNGATLQFRQADRDQSQEITADEWQAQVKAIDSFRAQYQTHGMLAIRLYGRGILNDNDVRTLATRGIPEVPSPLTDGAFVYFVKNGGLLTCLDLATGKRLYQERTGGTGTHYASPILAGGQIYTTAGDGRISVIASGPEFNLLATNDIGEKVYATPAVVEDTLYVRTHSTLYAFKEKSPTHHKTTESIAPKR